MLENDDKYAARRPYIQSEGRTRTRLCPLFGIFGRRGAACDLGAGIYRANIECASLGGTLCAERAALAAAITAGERRFVLLAVAGGDRPLTPCGICRQALAEFLPEGEDLPVVCAAAQGEERLETTLRSLLPLGFGGEDLHFVK